MTEEHAPEHKAENNGPTLLFGNKLYDILKFVALVALPAVGALYYSLAGIWHLPNADEVVGTIVAVDTFLGALVGIASKSYNNSDAKYDGDILVKDGEDAENKYTFALNDHPEELVQGKKELVFKVKPVGKE